MTSMAPGAGAHLSRPLLLQVQGQGQPPRRAPRRRQLPRQRLHARPAPAAAAQRLLTQATAGLNPKPYPAHAGNPKPQASALCHAWSQGRSASARCAGQGAGGETRA